MTFVCFALLIPEKKIGHEGMKRKQNPFSTWYHRRFNAADYIYLLLRDKFFFFSGMLENNCGAVARVYPIGF